ncbi:hypothetical protein [Corallococcus caeni]|uniref:hypothetical protein n=1 Tax=Corallococcus caeni TaxID=3082388 RepID=UPI0030C665C2
MVKRLEIERKIASGFGDILGKSGHFPVVVVDNQYQPVQADWIKAAIETDAVLVRKPYTRDVFDCDDYAFYLKTKFALVAQQKNVPAPFALGVLITKLHAFNFCFEPDTTLHLINTQVDGAPSTSNEAAFESFLDMNIPGNRIELIYI